MCYKFVTFVINNEILVILLIVNIWNMVKSLLYIVDNGYINNNIWYISKNIQQNLTKAARKKNFIQNTQKSLTKYKKQVIILLGRNVPVFWVRQKNPKK